MQKPKIFLIILSCISTIGSAQTFQLSGKVDHAPVGSKAFLSYLNKQKQRVIDSCLIRNGKFAVNGETNGPQMSFLTILSGSFKVIPDDMPNKVSFFLEPVHITAVGVYDQLKSLKFTGSTSQQEYAIYNKALNTHNDQIKPLRNELQDFIKQRTDIKKANVNDAHLTKVSKAIDSIREIIVGGYNKMDRKFIAENPKSVVSAFQLCIHSQSWNLDDVKDSYSKLTPYVKNSIYGQEIAAFIKTKDEVALGHKAKSFSATDVNGRTHHLGDFKGKYVILDFWASWCVPCRESTPHLIELFKKYHAKGLEVIAIADDDGKEDIWKKAIRQDQSDLWYNVLRGYKSDCDINVLYGITTIPVKFLIDTNGIIIGRYNDDNAKDMDRKLSELLD
jgi:thiol-disulfide isomerase/thioredoxin